MAFVLGIGVAGLDVDGVLAGFPTGLVVTLIGVTLLFGFARSAGTIDLLISWTLRLIGGRVAAVPWIYFGLSALLMGMGNLLAIAVIAPLAMDFARRHDLNRLMVGMMVTHGSLAGMFSPINPFGILVNSTLAREGLPGNPIAVALVPFAVNAALALGLYLAFRGYRGGVASEVDSTASDNGGAEGGGSGGTVTGSVATRSGSARLTGIQALALASLVVLVVLPRRWETERVVRIAAARVSRLVAAADVAALRVLTPSPAVPRQPARGVDGHQVGSGPSDHVETYQTRYSLELDQDVRPGDS